MMNSGMSTPRACHVLPTISRQGAGVSEFVRCLTNHWPDDGAAPSVLSFSGGERAADSDPWLKGSPMELQYSRFGPLDWSREMRQALSAMECGLFHVHGLWSCLGRMTQREALKRRIPYLLSPHGMLEPWAFAYKAWKKRPVWWLWERDVVRGAKVLHVLSRSEAQNLRNLGLTQPIAVVPAGVSVPDSVTSKPQADSRRTALFLSRIHPKKGLLNLVAAWKQLRPNGWQCRIVGPDDLNHRAEVQAAVAAAELNDDFEFGKPALGEAKWAEYRSADLFVLPTFSENFGLVVTEALGCGLPVITTKGAPWDELPTHGCGWWIDIGVEPLVNALREAMALSDTERREMGLRGRKLVEEKYTWESAARQMKSVYEWVLGGGAAPECVMTE